MLEINFDKLLTKPIFRILGKCVLETGEKSYVIGGYVRDYLIGKSNTKDIDIVVVGSGIKLAKNIKKNLPDSSKIQIFKSYGTAMINWKNLTLEFVGTRKESYSKESRNPKVFSSSLQDDQKRRDFTINTLAISLNKEDFGKLIDPFGGIIDLENKVIKTPLDPLKTFSDDPLRMLRAIRFSCQLNFKIESK